MTMTEWFPIWVTPVREGVYEVQMPVAEDRLGGYTIEQGFCYFGCNGWARTQDTIELAAKRNVQRGSQVKAWRGLLKEPKHD